MKSIFYFIRTVLMAGLLASCSPKKEGGQGQQEASDNSKAQAIQVGLAKDGKALMKIVVAEHADPKIKELASTLADYLGRICATKFEVTSSDGLNGIAMGLPSDFPQVPQPAGFFSADMNADATRKDDYWISSHKNGVYLIGATEIAVQHALWDFLYRLGYRQFFPGETWEIIPKLSNLNIAVDTKEHPSYFVRNIWYDYGMWDSSNKPYKDWCLRNRTGGSMTLNSGHAYEAIINRHKAEFAAHPEYIALVKGERKSTKFCISNPDLRKLVVADSLAFFKKDPTLQSVSLDPSDGGGWCECDSCKAIGSPTDLAVTLSNEVAQALSAEYPDKYVGMYAYNEHSPPPKIKVHPRVVVSIATAFINGNYTVDQLIDGWQKKADILGIREYFSCTPWDHDLPGAARGSNTSYLTTTIPHFQSRGARFYSAESGENWGANGWGYYLAARILWNVDQAKKTDELKADFLNRAFGSAKESMAKYYLLIDGTKRPLLTDDLIGRMYRFLAEAQKATTDLKVHARIKDLILYTHYVELWQNYTAAEGASRQTAFEEMIRYVYRIHPYMLIHSKALYRDVPGRDKAVSVPKDATWDVPEGKNPWKSTQPFSQKEVEDFLASGLANRKLFDFQPVSFSTNLVPSGKLGLPAVSTGNVGAYSRGIRNYNTWVTEKPTKLKFQAQGGHIYNKQGNAMFDLYPAAEAESKTVAHAEIPPDKQLHEVILETNFLGLHRVEVSDVSAGTSLIWPEGQPMTIQSSTEIPATLHGRWSLYFYVPKKTKVVAGYSSGPGSLLDGNGKTVYTFDKNPTYFSVPVENGKDGTLWKFQQCAGQRLLMTVPPYLARNEKELLLPREVVEADAASSK